MKRGFSLIEILIALAVAAILAAIVYPTYQHFVTKAHRSEGQVALFDLAQRMERYYQENNHTFAGASLENLGVNTITSSGYYRLSIGNTSATTYLLMATPIGMQSQRDTQCASLTLNQLGHKGITGEGAVEDCW